MSQKKNSLVDLNSLWSVFVQKPTNNTFVQLFRYTFVGGFAFVIDFSSLFILTEAFHIHYLVSAAIAFLIGLLINYSISVKWVFNQRKLTSRKNEVLIFAGIGVVGLGLNEVIIWLCTEIFLFHYLVSKIVSAVLVYLWNFFVRKFSLF